MVLLLPIDAAGSGLGAPYLLKATTSCFETTFCTIHFYGFWSQPVLVDFRCFGENSFRSNFRSMYHYLLLILSFYLSFSLTFSRLLTHTLSHKNVVCVHFNWYWTPRWLYESNSKIPAKSTIIYPTVRNN